MLDERLPRIVKVSKSQKSLLDYNEAGQYVPYKRQAPEFYQQAKMLFSDNEIILLAIWLVVSPSAALAYLIWIKYEHLRLFALVLFAVGIVHAIVQWHGVYTFVAQRFF
ncbi:MAG: hypothetical protein V1717_00730 [Candidatus Micrarchaeota archaeon]